MRKIAYLSMDVHARNCVLGDMDGNGKFRGNHSFITCENNIIKALKAVKAKRKYLVMEAGPLSNWAAQVANDHVIEAIICDPRETALNSLSLSRRHNFLVSTLSRLLELL